MKHYLSSCYPFIVGFSQGAALAMLMILLMSPC